MWDMTYADRTCHHCKALMIGSFAIGSIGIEDHQSVTAVYEQVKGLKLPPCRTSGYRRNQNKGDNRNPFGECVCDSRCWKHGDGEGIEGLLRKRISEFENWTMTPSSEWDFLEKEMDSSDVDWTSFYEGRGICRQDFSSKIPQKPQQDRSYHTYNRYRLGGDAHALSGLGLGLG